MLFKIIIHVRNFPSAGYWRSKTQDCACVLLNHPSIVQRPFHRRLGLALQQVLRKLDRHTPYQQPGFCAVGLKTGFFPETGLFCASLAATVSHG